MSRRTSTEFFYIDCYYEQHSCCLMSFDGSVAQVTKIASPVNFDSPTYGSEEGLQFFLLACFLLTTDWVPPVLSSTSFPPLSIEFSY